MFGSFGEARSHRGENLELHVGHGLECHRKRENRCRRVDLDVLRTQLPEIIREDYRVVKSFRASFVSFRPERNIYKRGQHIII